MNLYFDQKGQYWMPLASGEFISLGKSDIEIHALRNGHKSGKNYPKEPGLDELQTMFWRAQTFRMVKYAGPLAGHKAGPFERTSGERILVTNECAAFKRPLAKGKPFPFIEAYLNALIPDPEASACALGWLSCAFKSLIRCDYRPGQMIALVGPSGNGKSLFHLLVTELLGGRAGKPYNYFTGATPFNGDLAQAEHLVIEDEVSSFDIRKRQRFGSLVKQFAVNEEMYVNDKGKIAYTAPTFRRISISLNAPNITILPPMEDGTIDKIILIETSDAKGVLSDDRIENKRRIAEELPAFSAFLLSHRVPKSIACPRMGVKAYHNQRLLDALGDFCNESRLLGMIDEIIFHPAHKHVPHWSGSATELQAELESSRFGSQARQLFYYPSACGVFLSSLAVKHPKRFSSVKIKGKTEWRLRESD